MEDVINKIYNIFQEEPEILQGKIALLTGLIDQWTNDKQLSKAQCWDGLGWNFGKHCPVLAVMDTDKTFMNGNIRQRNDRYCMISGSNNFDMRYCKSEHYWYKQ